MSDADSPSTKHSAAPSASRGNAKLASSLCKCAHGVQCERLALGPDEHSRRSTPCASQISMQTNCSGVQHAPSATEHRAINRIDECRVRQWQASVKVQRIAHISVMDRG